MQLVAGLNTLPELPQDRLYGVRRHRPGTTFVQERGQLLRVLLEVDGCRIRGRERTIQERVASASFADATRISWTPAPLPS